MIFDGSKVDQNAPENSFDNQREGYDVVYVVSEIKLYSP